MNSTSAYISVLFALCMSVVSMQAQWIKTNGPYGAIVKCLVCIDSRIYAGTYGAGVFMSTNAGQSWAELSYGLKNSVVNTVCGNGTTLFVGTGWGSGGDVFRSTDQGASWTSVGLTEVGIVFSMTSDDTDVYAGTDIGIFHSSDSGATWEMVNKGLTRLDVTQVLLADSGVFATVNNGGIFRSTDKGQNWILSSQGLTDKNVHALQKNGRLIIAGTDAGLFTSYDEGANWSAVNNSVLGEGVYALAVDGSKFLVGSGGGVFRSDDSGSTWIEINSGLTDTSGVTALVSIPGSSGILIAGTNHSVFRSTDNGSRWEQSNADLSGMEATSLVANNTDIFVGTDFNGAGGGIFRSTDGGNAWTPIISGLPSVSITSLARSANTIVAGTSSRGGLYVSSDDGISWTLKDLTKSGVYALTSNPNIPGTFYCGTGYEAAFVSSDEGVTWSRITGGLKGDYVTAFVTRDTNLFAASWDIGVFISADSAQTWDKVNTGLTDLKVITLGASGTHLFAATFSGVFVSSDDGESWSSANAGLPAGAMVSSFEQSGPYLFAGTDTNGVYFSTNNGGNWIVANKGLPSGILITQLLVQGEYLYAATGSGVWKRTVSDIVAVESNAGELNKTCSLQQNYPNPFRSDTRFEFIVTSGDVASLCIFDVDGLVVRHFTINTTQTGHKCVVVWDGTNDENHSLPSGLYLVRLQSGQHNSTMKMMLIE